MFYLDNMDILNQWFPRYRQPSKFCMLVVLHSSMKIFVNWMVPDIFQKNSILSAKTGSEHDILLEENRKQFLD